MGKKRLERRIEKIAVFLALRVSRCLTFPLADLYLCKHDCSDASTPRIEHSIPRLSAYDVVHKADGVGRCVGSKTPFGSNAPEFN